MKIIKGLISVIMTNYNTSYEYLREAIESILSQTYSNFEFIIVDDASTDNSLSIIESYNDDRIRIIKNENNIGLTKSLNKALEYANGEFVARMDADDISLPERFERQVEFLRTNPDVIVCGTWVKFIGKWKELGYSNETICRSIPDRETYRIMLLFGNYPNIVHPTAMFRNEYLIENCIKYDEKFKYAQDYKMWVKCSEFGECANVPELLFEYRVHNNAISTSKKGIQEECALGIIREQTENLGIKISDENMKYIRGLFSVRKNYDLNIKFWIEQIIKANKKTKVYNEKKLKSMLWKKWAETTYFELYKTNYAGKIKALFLLPIRYYPELLKIRKARKKRKSINEISE